MGRPRGRHAEIRQLDAEATSSDRALDREVEVTSYAEVVARRTAVGRSTRTRHSPICLCKLEYIGRSSMALMFASASRTRSSDEKPLWAARTFVAYDGRPGGTRACACRPTGSRFLGRNRETMASIGLVPGVARVDGGRASVIEHRPRRGAATLAVFSLQHRACRSSKVRLTVCTAAFATMAALDAAKRSVDLADKYHDPRGPFERASTARRGPTLTGIQPSRLPGRRSMRMRFAAIQTVGEPHPLRRCVDDAPRARRAAGQRAEPSFRSLLWQLRHLGRPADRAGAHRGCGATAARSGLLFARTRSTLHVKAWLGRGLRSGRSSTSKPASYAEGAAERAGGRWPAGAVHGRSTGGEGQERCQRRASSRAARRRAVERRRASTLLQHGWRACVSSSTAGSSRTIMAEQLASLSTRDRARSTPASSSRELARAPLALGGARRCTSRTGSADSPTRGREYRDRPATGFQRTPLPWINVIANAGFGFAGVRVRRRLHVGR